MSDPRRTSMDCRIPRLGKQLQDKEGAGEIACALVLVSNYLWVAGMTGGVGSPVLMLIRNALRSE
jgi:hypothetical protein